MTGTAQHRPARRRRRYRHDDIVAILMADLSNEPSVIARGVAIAALRDAGLLPYGLAGVEIAPCPEGRVATVGDPTTDGGQVRRYLVDASGRLYALPSSCATPTEFLERYRSPTARAPFAIDAGGGR